MGSGLKKLKKCSGCAGCRGGKNKQDKGSPYNIRWAPVEPVQAQVTIFLFWIVVDADINISTNIR